MRICKTCKRELDDAEFYKKAACIGGRLPNCRDCVNKKASAYRAANAGKLRHYDRVRGRTEKRKQRVREYARSHPRARTGTSKAWAKRNRLKKRAHTAVREAVKDGRLIPQPCERCGEPKTQAHHPDYTKPLEVVWLCEEHHKALHRKYKEQ